MTSVAIISDSTVFGNRQSFQKEDGDSQWYPSTAESLTEVFETASSFSSVQRTFYSVIKLCWLRKKPIWMSHL